LAVTGAVRLQLFQYRRQRVDGGWRAEDWRMEDGGRRAEGGGWRMEGGRTRLTIFGFERERK